MEESSDRNSSDIQYLENKGHCDLQLITVILIPDSYVIGSLCIIVLLLYFSILLTFTMAVLT